MEHEYLFEKKFEKLEIILREKIEDNPDVSFICPKCGGFHIFHADTNEYGNFIYECEDCGHTMMANEIICE